MEQGALTYINRVPRKRARVDARVRRLVTLHHEGRADELGSKAEISCQDANRKEG